MIDRRMVIVGGAAAAFVASAAVALPQSVATLGTEVVRLWPGRPPGAPARLPTLEVNEGSNRATGHDRLLREIGDPCLVVLRPPRPNGGAVLLIPGGGYVGEGFDNEGTRVAGVLTARGLTAFVLVYRLPAEGWGQRSDVPLQDAQRAMRLIRAQAARFAIDPHHVAVTGFSAGGHLAGSLATRHDTVVYPTIDAVDQLSARPDVAGLIYPVVTLTQPFTHQGSRDALLGPGATEERARAYSVDTAVSATTPALFVVHTQDDPIVPVENSLMLATAMRAKHRPMALHLFEKGGHGFGVGLPNSEPASRWPELLLDFLTAHAMMANG